MSPYIALREQVREEAVGARVVEGLGAQREGVGQRGVTGADVLVVVAEAQLSLDALQPTGTPAVEPDVERGHRA